ncbi:protein kinase domain-containing protein [Pseudomarimonas arenosa]|uniref:non-specific serine/threonine protein kinase n=1 Tax=Pseudomarimonas arenosa TaxID=2774145 RepID=A0AAW3ZQ67_9GAMM|nr:protein kinase [Pseudomarimonas arenosa]MBD8527675.1 protein kinase [Pseudomarimonas arenosa]
MQPDSTPVTRYRIPLSLRIFLLIALILIAAIGGAVWVSLKQGSKIAERAVQHSLDASRALQEQFTAQRLEEVNLTIQLLAADAAFVNYISEAQGGGEVAGNVDPLLTESASIHDLLIERQEAFLFDFGMVLDFQGNVLARTDDPEAFQQSMAEDPFVAPAIRELRPFSDFWRMGTAIYQAAILPLDQSGDLIGFLIIGKRINDDFSQQIRRGSDADIVFLVPQENRAEILGSSLDQARNQALARQLQDPTDPLTQAVVQGSALPLDTLVLGESEWIVRLNLLAPEGGASVGSALQLSSKQAAEAGYREILNTVGLAGGLALALALPLSLMLTRRSLSPLRTMAKMAKDAVAGNYQSRIAIQGRDELAQLSHAFDSLLSDLRGERDIEAYVTNLSRLMPEPGAEEAPSPATTQPTPIAPSRTPMTLVSLDARRLLPKDEGPDSALPLINAWTAIIEGVAATASEFDGQLVQHAGSRLTVGFAGEKRLVHALQFVREVLSSEPETPLAVFDGPVVRGALMEDGLPVATVAGLTLPNLERLACEAQAGRALLPKQLGEHLKSMLGADAVSVIKGAASGKAFYAIDAGGLAGLPAPAVRPSTSTAQDTIQRPATVSGLSSARTSETSVNVGSRLGGRFQILSVLGKGGMGVVYKARDLELDDVVAIKMLRSEALRDGDQLERLKSEIKLARRITHPNVLRTFDFGEINGLPFISMEYVRGMTLRFMLDQSDRIPYSAALRIARQLCAGLQAAHEVGVLHRDIKPENLILEASGNAKLMDFGIARPIRRQTPGSTDPGMYVGTPAYSAPEQLSGQDVDHRADIFASGVLMCELFCGSLPFEGNSTVEIYMNQMQFEPKAPREMWPQISPALEALILRCIQRNVGDRFQSAAELGTALSELRA